MAEIFLSATIQVLIQKLLSPELINYARHEGVLTAVKKWEETLTTIWEVLDDAEEKQINNRALTRWLDKLRDLAYDVEDILDEFDTEASRHKPKAGSEASTSRVQSLISNCCTSLKPSTVMFNGRMRSKIKEITARLEEIGTRKKSDLELREIAGGTSNRTREKPVNQTSSSIKESRVFGRDKDKEKIIELLFRDEASSGEGRVISIIGLGGIGKTTLAQDVYNDDKVKGYFDPKAWVCVSDNEVFDVIGVTKTILEAFLSKTSDVNDLNGLQGKLQKELSKKKFLLVLDDVWHENHNDWTILRKPLEAGAPGSKIIVTTRNERVSDALCAKRCPLEKLSIEDCRFVFVQALGKSNFGSDPNFGQIVEEIVQRCDGLPLAAKALGGLLHNKASLKEWEDVLESQLWHFSESGIIPALRLSYRHLPPDLKQCFAYCSIFPKDYEFEEEELVLLWMAAGLVQQQDERKQMEEIGHEYFHDLLSRSFFQRSSEESRFVMHDLIHDLAQWVAGETCFRLEGKKQYKVSKKVRHLSYTDSNYDGVQKFEGLDEVKHLRTFLPLERGRWSHPIIPLDFLLKFRCLRVLSVNGYHVTKLPNSIGDMKHLRYLNLSHTNIQSLPETTCILYNLQTLIVRDCSNLKNLPTKMSNLINLRHLDITDASSIKRMPPGVGELSSLRKLSNFIVGNGNGYGIRELMKLKYLQGTLCISSLENVMDDRDAIDANLKDKQDLEVLRMEWNSQSNGSRKEMVEEVFDMLQPHENLKKLVIKCFDGIRLPTWLGDPSFSKMAVLELEGCVNCTSLPPLGKLPFLEDLRIQGANGVKSVGPEFYGVGYVEPFPKLKNLKFEDMGEWEDWLIFGVDTQVEVFPKLSELSIEGCPKLLGKLPDHLPSLEKLVIHECQQFSISSQKVFPCLREVSIEGCPKLSGKLPDHLPFLAKPVIYECQAVANSSLSKLSKLHIEDQREVLNGSVGSTKSMILSYNSKQQLDLTQGLTKGVLKIKDCTELTSLWKKELGLLRHLTYLCHHLEINDCPKFVSLVAEEVGQQGLPCRLESLELYSCEKLQKLQGLHSLTSLRKLSIIDCPSLVFLPETCLPSSLIELRIGHCDALKSLPQEMMHCSDCGSLEYLRVESCQSLTSISRGQLPSTLKRLKIKDCESMLSLLDNEEGSTSSRQTMQKSHNSSASLLERLSISECPSLTSLSSRGELPATLKRVRVEGCPKLELVTERLHNNTSLERIKIWNCESLKSLPNGLHHLTHLCEFKIGRCPSLVSFPVGGLPATNLTHLSVFSIHSLTSLQELRIEGCPIIESFPDGGLTATKLSGLSIKNCENLRSLPDRLYYLTSLQELTIEGCPSIESFPKEGFPTKLTRLYIRDLKIGDPLFEWRLHRLTSLQVLSIGGSFPDVVSFPEEKEKGRMMLPASLTQLSIRGFQNLKYLSSERFRKLTSLNDLSISDCPNLKSFPQIHTSLRSLEIKKCPKLKSFPKEGFRKLTSLYRLWISDCPSLKSFPEIHNSSLQFLSIDDFPKLKSFPKEGFQKLTSLYSLSISNCPSLESFPEIHNSSLQNLTIRNCPKLESFPKEGLPPSLFHLCISGCPRLQQLCKKDQGRYWPKIAHIPFLLIPETEEAK